MTITVAKWGNSAGVRIPANTLKLAGLSVGDKVRAEVQPDRSIVLRPHQERPAIDVFAMIDKITPDTLPDFAQLDEKPVGKEIW
jgi:antitoxin ChpS